MPGQRSINLSLIFIISLFLLFPQKSWAYGIDEEMLRSSEINPYSYFPTRKLMPQYNKNELRMVSLPSVAPSPMIISDVDGNKSFYRNGKLLVRIDPAGNQKYYIGNVPRFDRDSKGKVTRRYKFHSPTASIENEFGEIIGWQEFGRGGLLMKEYDEKRRLVRVYEYDNRRLKAVLDTLTNSRTIYNERGKPDREVNFHGATTMRYSGGESGKLLYKTDLYGNKTVYLDDGRREKATYDADNNVIATYEWTNQDTYKVTDQYGNTTYVVENRAQYETNYTGTITKRYAWEGTKLISSTDIFKEETTYYVNGRPTETRYNGFLAALWKYDDAQTGTLVSYTNREGKTTYYDHGREGIGITDDNFNLDSFSWDYKPLLFDEILQLVHTYKDTSHSIAPDIEGLIRNRF